MFILLNYWFLSLWLLFNVLAAHCLYPCHASFLHIMRVKLLTLFFSVTSSIKVCFSFHKDPRTSVPTISICPFILFSDYLKSALASASTLLTAKADFPAVQPLAVTAREPELCCSLWAKRFWSQTSCKIPKSGCPNQRVAHFFFGLRLLALPFLLPVNVLKLGK